LNQRFYALDVFRGATVALMILVNTPGTWDYIYPPLRHAEWHGLTPTDLVFPFFLFAVGNAMAFVMPKFYKESNTYFWKKVLKRTAIIFTLGLLLNWFPFVQWHGSSLEAKPWSFNGDKGAFGGIRILGVLQRIAICYLIASVSVYYFKKKGAIIITALLLLGYWLICYLGNPTDPYSLTGWVGIEIDKAVLTKHHMYFGEVMQLKSQTTNAMAKTMQEIGTNTNIITKVNGRGDILMLFDPEGLLSTIAAIAQVILGYLVGSFIIKNGNNANAVLKLLLIGFGLWIVGHIWGNYFPLNKKIWSSSYTVITSGMATFCIALFIYLFEIIKIPQFFGKFFDAFGKNPLFIFVLSGALPRLMGLIKIPNGISTDGKPKFINPFAYFYETVCKPIGETDLRLGSFIYAISFILFYWLICYILDKKKIYIKV
jgi:predicted acyltransferase